MSEERSINPTLKMALEIGPIAVFFLAFQYGGSLRDNPRVANIMGNVIGPDALAGASGPILIATALFMVAIAVSLTVSWMLTRTLPKMAVVTGVVVAVFGGLTLWLQDDTFIKMKPTIVNGIFAAILAFGLFQGRSYLKYLMGEAMPLSDEGWMIFTRRWVWFFLFLAAVNETVWRTQTTEFWVSFKTFANIPLTLAFIGFQWPLFQKHSLEPEQQDGQP
ncbi:MAG: septation protein A [Paracoccaceae bacterium]